MTKVVEYQRKWNAAAASVMPDTDFNSAEFEYSDVENTSLKEFGILIEFLQNLNSDLSQLAQLL